MYTHNILANGHRQSRRIKKFPVCDLILEAKNRLQSTWMNMVFAMQKGFCLLSVKIFYWKLQKLYLGNRENYRNVRPEFFSKIVTSRILFELFFFIFSWNSLYFEKTLNIIMTSFLFLTFNGLCIIEHLIQNCSLFFTFYFAFYLPDPLGTLMEAYLFCE